MKYIYGTIIYLFHFFVLGQTFEEKIDSISNLIKITKKESNKLDLMVERFNLYYSTQPKMDTIEYERENILTLASKNQDSISAFETDIVYAYILVSKSEYDKADTLINRILLKLNKQTMPALYVKANTVQLISAIQQTNQDIKFKDRIDELIKLGEELNDASLKFMAYNLANYYYFYSFEPLSAFKMSLKMLYVFDGNNLKENAFIRETELYSAIASSAGEIGNFNMALKYFSYCLEKNKKTSNKKDIPSNLYNIGFMYYLLKEYKLSLKYLMEALELSRKQKLDHLSNHILSNLPDLFIELQDYDKALFYANELTVHAINPHYLSEAYKKSSEVYLLKDNLTKAKYYLDKAIEHAQSDWVELNILKSEYYAAKGELEKAITIAQESSENIKQKDSFEGKLFIYKLLNSLHLKNNDFKNAHKYLTLYNELNDSINTKKNVSKITSINLAYEFNRKIDSLKLVTQKEQILQQKQLSSEQNFSKILLLGFGALLIFCGAIFYFSNQRKKITNNLQLKQKELENLNNLNNQLITIISHDVKLPLVSINHVLQSILEKELKEESENSEYIVETIKEISDLEMSLNNIIGWGENQLNKHEVDIQCYSVIALIKECLKIWAPQFGKKSIKIQNYINEDSEILVDKNHFILVMRNILSNAYKFTPENGFVEINSLKEPNYFTIKVHDSGPGVNPELVTNTFNKNKKLIPTNGTLGEIGTGLGLYISKEMMEQNNGTLWLESSPNKGTTVFIKIPISPK